MITFDDWPTGSVDQRNVWWALRFAEETIADAAWLERIDEGAHVVIFPACDAGLWNHNLELADDDCLCVQASKPEQPDFSFVPYRALLRMDEPHSG